MSELAFCKQYLSALDARPSKLSSDHIADAKQYPSGAVFVLPRLPHPQHPQRPNPKATPDASSSSTPTLTITLKPMKPSAPTVPLTNIDPSKTSIYDLKTSYSTAASIPAAKTKILYKKKPVADSKTVAEVVGSDAGGEVEFGVMIMGGATGATPTAGTTPVTSPPAVAPSEAERGLAAGEEGVPAAQGPSGKEVVNEEFWEDLKGFVVQRIRDEKEGERLVGVFKSAWEKER